MQSGDQEGTAESQFSTVSIGLTTPPVQYSLPHTLATSPRLQVGRAALSVRNMPAINAIYCFLVDTLKKVIGELNFKNMLYLTQNTSKIISTGINIKITNEILYILLFTPSLQIPHLRHTAQPISFRSATLQVVTTWDHVGLHGELQGWFRHQHDIFLDLGICGIKRNLIWQMREQWGAYLGPPDHYPLPCSGRQWQRGSVPRSWKFGRGEG